CHQALRDWYTALLSLRRELPGLEDDRLEASQVTWDEDAGWLRLRRGALLVVCNFAAEPREVPLGVDGPVSLRLASDSVSTEAPGRVLLPPAGVGVFVAGEKGQP